MRLFCGCSALLLAVILSLAQTGRAYSVLTHEAIIDSAWEDSIRPALLKRFPNAQQDELRTAHSYAYGGAIIQDMGYYPHGNKLFSDLTHYVRSGDFIEALLRDAQDLNEYAFALGAMSHYVADNYGHRLGTNVAEPLLYPRLEEKYGSVMNYEEDPLAHVMTEFGFDVLEVAKGRYAPDAYRDFIGFNVAERVLDQAFQETYGLRLQSVFGHQERVIGSYRRAVSSLIPKATKVAWALKKDDIEKSEPGITRDKFLYNVSRASYERNWGRDYQRPSFFDEVLAFLFRLVPKIGALRILKMRTPTPEAEKLLEASFNSALDHYRVLLKEEWQAGKVRLPNDNFDLGTVAGRGEYWMGDRAMEKLTVRLSQTSFEDVTPELRADLLQFYAEPPGHDSKKLSAKDRRKLRAALEELRNMAASVQGASKNASMGEFH
jgi:hypothetical protein